MERTIYREIKPTPHVWIAGTVLGSLIALAALCVFYIEHHGHIVTGMTNQIFWGIPHVFAIFLIVAASGALNVASIASVFGQAAYKPLARLSSVLAIALLAGGLAVLVLDLGRPDMLLVAMTKYNFSSIFAWNIYLYTGFFAVVIGYLYVQMARGVAPTTVKAAGTVAFVWRLVLTTGTGSIFGWLVARPGYDAAIMAPLFIAMSFSFGLAVFILVSLSLCRITGRDFGDFLLRRLGRLLGIFVALVLYLTAVQHLTNLYAAEHAGIEKFILMSGGIYTVLFWIGQVVLGGIVPLALTLGPKGLQSRRSVVLASSLVIIGAFSQIYVIVIGGQAFPIDIFPGYQANSTFFDGQIANYKPSAVELGLGGGGIALTLVITGFVAVVLRILPTTLSDANVASAK
ncbi:MAG: polysulfide reductase NrfD [Hyphomicrobiales bacterium]|nr:polysulfide reductase NrfD [Hyphomicrobiales bacterium]